MSRGTSVVFVVHTPKWECDLSHMTETQGLACIVQGVFCPLCPSLRWGRTLAESDRMEIMTMSVVFDLQRLPPGFKLRAGAEASSVDLVPIKLMV